MFLTKSLSATAALAMTTAGLVLFISAPAAGGQGRPAVVTAPIQDDLPTRRVSYADLNLASLAGERTLVRRVKVAVRTVCQEANGFEPLNLERIGCRKFAWNGAAPQIDRAVERAREIASTGKSSIALAAIQIRVPR